MVTAELAVALPALVAVLLLALAGVTAATAQLRCVDAAREGARAAARGESPSVARAAALREAPRGSVVTVRVGGGLVTVTVRGQAGAVGSLPGLPVSGRAVAAQEPGAL